MRCLQLGLLFGVTVIVVVVCGRVVYCKGSGDSSSEHQHDPFKRVHELVQQLVDDSGDVGSSDEAASRGDGAVSVRQRRLLSQFVLENTDDKRSLHVSLLALQRRGMDAATLVLAEVLKDVLPGDPMPWAAEAFTRRRLGQRVEAVQALRTAFGMDLQSALDIDELVTEWSEELKPSDGRMLPTLHWLGGIDSKAWHNPNDYGHVVHRLESMIPTFQQEFSAFMKDIGQSGGGGGGGGGSSTAEAEVAGDGSSVEAGGSEAAAGVGGGDPVANAHQDGGGVALGWRHIGHNTVAGDSDLVQDSRLWSDVALFREGNRDANCDKWFPATCALIETMPDIRTCFHGVVLFSRIQPGAKLRPHTGPTNARLTVHCGIQVPPNVSITVGGERRTWEEGKCLVFDDAVEHHVEHHGTPGVDEDRVVLLLHMWQPQIGPAERQKRVYMHTGLTDFDRESINKHLYYSLLLQAQARQAQLAVKLLKLEEA